MCSSDLYSCRQLSGALLVITTILAWSLSTAYAAPIDQARRTYLAGDYDEAMRLMTPLAAQDEPEAQFLLGLMYLNGRGVAPDPAEGLRLHRLVAEKGYAQAQYSVGLIYARGRGVPRDDDEAAKWFRLAAEQGDALAQFDLGIMHTNGRGVPADDVQAYLWIALAVQGSPPGQRREAFERNRDVVREHLSPAQFAEAERLLAAWKPKQGPRFGTAP